MPSTSDNKTANETENTQAKSNDRPAENQKKLGCFSCCRKRRKAAVAVVHPMSVEMTAEQYKQYQDYVQTMTPEQKAEYDTQLADVYEHFAANKSKQKISKEESETESMNSHLKSITGQSADLQSVNTTATVATVVLFNQKRERQNFAPRGEIEKSGSLHAATSHASATASINLVPKTPSQHKRERAQKREQRLMAVTLAPIISQRALIPGSLPSPGVLQNYTVESDVDE